MYDSPGTEVKADVQLVDLRPCYEKGQSRRKANSEQRLLDAEVHLVAEFERQIQVRSFARLRSEGDAATAFLSVRLRTF